MASAWRGRGLEREEITSLDHVLPGVRFAVDAYVNFARRAPWQEAVCSSLTELFAPEIHKKRLANWPQHYPWIEPDGYCSTSASACRKRGATSSMGSRVTLDHFRTREQQQRALEILQFKLDVLWAMLDAMQLAYGSVPEVTMSDEAPIRFDAVPAIARHFRFQWEPAQTAYVLLYPEGMVKLSQQRRRDHETRRRQDAASMRSSHDLEAGISRCRTCAQDVIEFPGGGPWKRLDQRRQ